MTEFQPPRVYKDADIDLGHIRQATVAVIGYGNQGHAHAQNLRDSGVATLVGVRPGGTAFQRASAAGFDPMPMDEAAARADCIMLTLPDEVIPEVYERSIAPHLSSGKVLSFAHGLAVHFQQIVLPKDIDVALVAPKGAGHWLRDYYVRSGGLAALAAVHQDASGQAFDRILAYAGAIGCGRAGILRTTFEAECVTDLFGEQAVLCGGIPGLLQAGYQTLVDAGYPPDLAYFECVQEAKLIVDLIADQGFDAMRAAISNTAEIGGYDAQEALVDQTMRDKMANILGTIRTGSFAKSLKARAGHSLDQHRRDHSDDTLEAVGGFIRSLQPKPKD